MWCNNCQDFRIELGSYTLHTWFFFLINHFTALYCSMNRTPLRPDYHVIILYNLASMNGNVELARILIENGADVNKVDKIKKSSLMASYYYFDFATCACS